FSWQTSACVPWQAAANHESPSRLCLAALVSRADERRAPPADFVRHGTTSPPAINVASHAKDRECSQYCCPASTQRGLAIKPFGHRKCAPSAVVLWGCATPSPGAANHR